MSVQQLVEEADIDVDELLDSATRGTIPGPSNEPYEKGLLNGYRVVNQVIEELNNWFYIVDVRVYGQDHIAIPMRYRWTIVRWSNQDMDRWLMNNGWKDHAHLNADTRTREENEMEARYRKVIDGVTVDCTFLVEWPPIVFEKMEGMDIEQIKKRKMKREARHNSIERIANMRRE